MFTEEIPGWCAGQKCSLQEHEIPDSSKKQQDLQAEILDGCCYNSGSVAIVSTNSQEKKVIAFLKKFKWIPGPSLRNWGNESSYTRLWFFQIPKSQFKAYQEDNTYW